MGQESVICYSGLLTHDFCGGSIALATSNRLNMHELHSFASFVTKLFDPGFYAGRQAIANAVSLGLGVRANPQPNRCYRWS